MQKLSSRLIALSPFLLVAACSDVNLGVEKTDGGDAAAGTTVTGAGASKGAGGSGGSSGSGGLSGTGGSVPGTGGRTLGTGGALGTGGGEVVSGGIPGTGGRVVGTGGVSGSGGTGSGGVSGSGGITSGICTASACATDGGQSAGDAPAGEDSTTERSCTYNGKTYPNGVCWWASDGCNELCCLDGSFNGTGLPCAADAGGQPHYSCGYTTGTYPYGVTFPSTDGCNICECAFYWYRPQVGSVMVGPLVSCTSYDCSSSPGRDAGSTSDGGIDACVYNGKTYPSDTYFPSADGCDECHCRTDGQITCTFQHYSCGSYPDTRDGSIDVQ